MSDTPMVDGRCDELDKISETPQFRFVSMRSLARQLERERDALRAEVDRTYKAWCGRDLMHLPLCEAVGKRIEIADQLASAALRACQSPHNKAQ